jgi:hypothetical protein
MTDLNILIRVEKLLAQAADPAATEPERETFQAKAFELIQRHRIDEAQIGGHLAADDVLGQFPIGSFDGIYGRVRIDIVGAVAAPFDVHLFWSGYGNKRRLKGYGFKSDVDRVIALTNRLLADADVRARTLDIAACVVSPYNSSGDSYKSDRGAVQAATIRERRGFYMGYADAVLTRLMQARKTAEAAHRADTSEAIATSTALVLVDRRREVNDRFRADVGKLKSAGGLDGSYGGGRSAGYEAGAKADLSHQNQVRSQKALGR